MQLQLSEAILTLALSLEQVIAEARREALTDLHSSISQLLDQRHSSSPPVKSDTSPRTVMSSSEWTQETVLSADIVEALLTSQFDI